MSIKWSFVKISSLRNPREHGTSLFPIFNASNRTSKKKKSCIFFAKTSIIQRYYWKDCSLLHLWIHQTGSAVTVPEYYRGFPPSLSCYFHFALLYPYSSESHILASVQKHCVYFQCVYFLKEFPGRRVILSEIIWWANDPKSQVQTVWKFTWSRWTTHWIERPDSHGSDLWVPSLSALMTRWLSAETESMGFPIHLSTHISSASDKGIIMSLINCESVLFKFVWTASGKSDDVCFHSHCQILWHTKMTPREHCCHSTIRCTNQIMMSLLFAHLWSGARPQLQLPVDPAETHTGTTKKKEASLNMWGSEEEASVKTKSPRQWPRAWASGSDLDKEGERRSSRSEAERWRTWS